MCLPVLLPTLGIAVLTGSAALLIGDEWNSIPLDGIPWLKIL